MNNTQTKTVSIYFTQDELDLIKVALNSFSYHAAITYDKNEMESMSYVLAMIPVIKGTEITTEFNLDYYQVQGLITPLSFLNNATPHAHIKNDTKLLSDRLFNFIFENELTIDE